MDPKELIIIHETNTLERALKILIEGIRPSTETGEINWYSDKEICLTGIDFKEILACNTIWGHIRFVIKNSWIKKNVKEHFKDHATVALLNDDKIWWNFLTKYKIQNYEGSMNTSINQLICDIPIPKNALECVVIYSHYNVDLREKELIKKNLPKGMKLFTNENNNKQLIGVI
ncbi:MAG: hypothetical protein QT08_C0014G0002 [archaeon GW2011_AR17]|nr:MAG: hypothetical protein QT08_C0014G0002 [archaeon GW2011_AR17]MBS3154577.1 hypothetical protein [Candidatus Woesearchaeota archaeon]HIH14897.1 hypothetical protein [Nanoarchaeota archaeon]HIH58965.1 hypothetical protein [Nanoarchaeota archaeon]HII14208.1 hypothetical protein [Nanoarchaeota archaeon]